MPTLIKSNNYNIEVGSITDSSFYNLLTEKYKDSKKIIMVDENTHDYCLEFILTSFEELADAEVILLPSGEENKVMEVCLQVWSAISEFQTSRSDLVINIGGGLVCDMGGLIASLYKRGLDYINIPTSLLAMTDASVGGKTAVNLDHYKNQLGVFSNPVAVYVDPSFLETLPLNEIKNGFAEMLKHGLLADQNHWKILKCILPEEDIFGEKIIADSIQVKNNIVLLDEQEKNERKKLNFGHTIGHALESYFMGSDFNLQHGHAVAIGMLAETFISFKKELLNQEDLNDIRETITKNFLIPEEVLEADPEVLFEIMLNDKKNFDGKIQCTLLNGIGQSLINQEIDMEDLKNGLQYLKVP